MGNLIVVLLNLQGKVNQDFCEKSFQSSKFLIVQAINQTSSHNIQSGRISPNSEISNQKKLKSRLISIVSVQFYTVSRQSVSATNIQ